MCELCLCLCVYLREWCVQSHCVFLDGKICALQEQSILLLLPLRPLQHPVSRECHTAKTILCITSKNDWFTVMTHATLCLKSVWKNEVEWTSKAEWWFACGYLIFSQAWVPSGNSLVPVESKRHTKPKRSDDFNTTNIVDRSARRSIRCLVVETAKTAIHRYNFFPRTIVDNRRS